MKDEIPIRINLEKFADYYKKYNGSCKKCAEISALKTIMMQ
jgi:hypothetical protein